jgi:exodeoxyribonuclease III
VLCFEEIKTDNNKIVQKGIKQALPLRYKQYWNCCTSKKGYSGTAVLTKVEPLNVHYGMIDGSHNEEGRIMTLEYAHFVLIAVYTPNSGREGREEYRISEWEADFRLYMSHLKDTMGKPIIIAGDLNVAHHRIDISDPDLHIDVACFKKSERVSFQAFLNLGFVDIFRHLHPKA